MPVKKLSLLLVVATSLLLNSCSKQEEGHILIRVQNQSSKSISDVVVFSYSAGGIEAQIPYGTALAGQATGYRQHVRADNYPFMKFTMQGHPPYESAYRCLTGISELAEGRYTFVVKEENAEISVHIIKD